MVLHVHNLSHSVFVTVDKSILPHTSSPPGVGVCIRSILCGLEQMHPDVFLLLWCHIYTVLKCVSPSPTGSLAMAQVEKRGGLLRKSSASKKPLKEKVVLMYDEIFMVRPGPRCPAQLDWFSVSLKKEKLKLCLIYLYVCTHMCV